MTPGHCHSCGRPVVIARVPWRASSLAAMSMRFSDTTHEAFRVEMEPERAGRGPDALGVLVGLLEDGAWVAGELTARATWRAAPVIQMRVPHDISCPAAAERRAAPPGDKAHCSGCGRTIHWLWTPNGKKAPIDPEPHTGVRLGKAEARAARGSRGYVIGLDRDGMQASIREGEQLLLGGGEQVLTTVWVNHFATCPRRADFVRPR